MTLESTMGMDGVRTTREPDGSDGVIGSVLALSMGMVESGIRTSSSLGRTITSETQRIVDGVFALGDQASQAAFRTSRKLVESAFGLATEAIDRSEAAMLVVLQQGQETTDRAAELVAQASQVAVGSRGVASVTTARA